MLSKTQHYLMFKSFLVVLAFASVNSTKAGKNDNLNVISCRNQTYRITITTPCPIPNGIHSYEQDSLFRKNTSTVVVEKSEKIIFKSTVNCKGIMSDSGALFFTWFMDKDSYNQSTFVFTALTYDTNVEAREFNEISLEKLDSRTNTNLTLKSIEGLNLRDEVTTNNSKVICTGF